MSRNATPSSWSNSKSAVMMGAWSQACAPRPAHSQRRAAASKPAHASASKRTRWPIVLAVVCVAVIVIIPLG